MNLDEIIPNQTPQQTNPPAPNQNITQEQVVNNDPVQNQVDTTPPSNNTVAVTPPANNPYQVQQQQIPQVNVNVWWWHDDIHVDMGKREKTYGFFRIIILIVLIVTGFLLLCEVSGIYSFAVNDFLLSQIYPIIILLSAVALFSYKKFLGKIIGIILFASVVLGILWIWAYHSFGTSDTNKFQDKLSYNIWTSGDAIVEINTYLWNYNLSWGDIDTFLDLSYKSDRELLENTGFTSDNTPYLYLNEDSNWNVIQNPSSKINLVFNSKNIIDFYAKNFIGNFDLDFTDILWEAIEINGWVGDFHIKLGDKIDSWSLIKIKSVFSYVIEIDIPKSVGINLYYSQLAGSIELTNFEKSLTEKGYFKSTNIKDAKKILNIDASVWYWNLKINWID